MSGTTPPKIASSPDHLSFECVQESCGFKGEECLCRPMHHHFEKAELRAARTIELNEGDQLAPEDFPEPVVFAVLNGVIAVESHLSDGRRSLLTLRFPGEYLDMNRADRHASGEVVALAPTLVKLVPRNVFEELLLLDSNLRRIYWRRATDIMHQQFDHSSDLGKKTPTERMASFIFELRNRMSIPRFVEEFTLPISRQSIADYLGLRAETVSRVLKSLEKEGAVKLIGKHKIAVLDFKGLRKIANGARPRLSNHR